MVFETWFAKQFWMMVEEVSLQDTAIMFVAYTMSRALRRELASLLFSTQVRYLSASFFLYLLFAERMMPWSSGCIIEVALEGSVRVSSSFHYLLKVLMLLYSLFIHCQ